MLASGQDDYESESPPEGPIGANEHEDTDRRLLAGRTSSTTSVMADGNEKADGTRRSSIQALCLKMLPDCMPGNGMPAPAAKEGRLGVRQRTAAARGRGMLDSGQDDCESESLPGAQIAARPQL